MNIFAEGIIKYDTANKASWVHNIKMPAPLPLGSGLKISRCSLDIGELPTSALLDKVRRETFIDLRYKGWVKEGIWVHVIAAPQIFNGDKWHRNINLHLVPKNIFHLVEQKDEYEWWQLTDEEKELLENRKLSWN